ncbi:MAG TPA: SDR family NAD(P)-dependent oxidoreductase, partial [Actinomycetota bacterium]|nr:SDR family NAD(P)-dependent oxidoreductase [Actinomycetota bacterium]
MAGRLEGKVALITGAAGGQGAAHADLFTREGAAVVLGDIVEDVVVARVDRLRGAGFAAEGLSLDVTRAD